MAAGPQVRKNCMKFLEGYLDHRGQDNKWRTYWLVLKDQTLYIFKSKQTVQDNLVGSLQVNGDTKFVLGDSDPKKECFRFDLRTSRHQNKFKAKKYSERELWRGYIEGLATGAVPSGLDLMHGQIQMIADEIRNYFCNKEQPTFQKRPSSIGSDSVSTGFSDPEGSFGSFGSIESETMSTNNGGPFMKHKFWMESYRTDTPSWFFSNCTRELAEKILLGSPQLGNTLMRESHTYKNNGSYTISKLVSVERCPLSHFEVIRVAAGYKINAENAPETFQCLADVMKHFVKISGAAATRPFVTNDYKKLGIETPDYTTKIVKVDNDNGEELQHESYEEPVTPPWKQIDGSKTLPNRAHMQSFKSPVSATHVSPRDKSQRPGIEQVDHSAAMAGALSNLDKTIRRYDDEHPYNRRAYSEYKDLKYLPPAPVPPGPLPPLIPLDQNTSVVLKTNRSKSVPAVEYNPLEQKVPVTRPGMVMVKRNQSSREANKNPQSPRGRIQSDGFDSYRSGSVPVNLNEQGNDDPYKSSRSYQSNDPYRRDQENPYKGRSLPPPPIECHSTQLYQNLPPPQNTTSPTNSPLNSPCSPITPTSPRSSGGDSMLLGDIQSQLAKLKPTGKVTTGPLSPEVKSPPPVAPKSKPAAHTANNRTSGNIISNVSASDNVSSGSRKDINDNNTNIVEECHATGESKEDIKKRLEAIMGGSKVVTPPVPMIPKTKSVPNIPLPPLPLDHEEVYEEINQD